MDGMNTYGTRAERHWRQWRPQAYSQIPEAERETFFAEMGERAASRIGDLMLELAGEDPPGETYLDKVGRLNMAKLRAEEVVLAEEVLADPEPGTEEDPEETPTDSGPVTPESEWMPTVIEPGHPLFEEIRAEHQD